MPNSSLEEIHFNMIDQYFKSTSFVNHHIESYNQFYNHDIKEVLHYLNPLHFSAEADQYQIKMYFGGKNMDKLYFGKPTIYENGKMKLLFPNEARLRNITYASSLHCNIDIEFYDIKQHKKRPIETSQIQKYYMGMIPIMLQSKPCNLYSLSAQTRYSFGECKHDYGGYFIIDGKEKALIPQEVYANNMIYIREVKDNIHDYSVEIRSISKDETKPKRTFAIRRVMKNDTIHNQHFVAFIPNVRKEVPLFILFRALGLLSDKSIIMTILGDLENKEDYIELLRPSVIDSGGIYTQKQAIEYITELTKEKNIYNTHYILCDFLLPHIGEMNYSPKCYFLGYMIFETLKVIQKTKLPTDRDHFKYKRVETCGIMMKQLFSEYATIMYKEFHQQMEKDYNFNKGKYLKKNVSKKDEENSNNEEEKEDNPEIQISSFMSLIMDNYSRFFQEKIIHDGFQKAFKGNWGAYSHTKRIGAIQPLNRLSFNSALSHLRKINLDIDSSSKMTGPHKLHSSQWGVIDPVDTPDGGNVGLHKHMALMCGITHDMDDTPLIQWILRNMNQTLSFNTTQIKLDCIRLEEASATQINTSTMIFVNNKMIGVTTQPFLFKKLFLEARRLRYIPIQISFLFDIKDNYIFIFSDGGRLVRPVLYLENDGTIGYLKHKKIFFNIKKNTISWEQYTHGFAKHTELYTNIDDTFHSIQDKKAILEYLDKNEEESTYICLYANELQDMNKSPYSHCEIHPSMMFGIMGSQVIFPEHNQLPRNLFSCGQSKQAASLYHSNFQNRIDTMGVVLNYGEVPLVKSRLLHYIHENQHPYGFNAIVAIMCYDAYNVEDAILINEGSLKRGMFHTTYYNMYEAYEESSDIGDSTKNTVIQHMKNEKNVELKPGYDYNYLDDYGLIRENTPMDDKKILIGRVSFNEEHMDVRSDTSITSKKGQLGYVDKSYITEGEQGHRIAKIRIREQRIPTYGDKFCSRCGQKGTIGNIVREENMPFTKDGIKPDIIINPHALPSRMTIGQLIETIMTKLGLSLGHSMDATPFTTEKSKIQKIGDLLSSYGMHRSGNEYLYHGMTGEMIEHSIFIGPTYYLRLKHMVKDKINFRASGKRTLLTRQTNHGRANDGGLRIGEMERDGIIGHGCAYFLKDSMMHRGDKYKLAICNHSGTIAIYDSHNHHFYSPNIDGPIQYDIEGKEIIRSKIVTKFGKDFSIVEVPYCFKLLLQELSAMNVQMRIITNNHLHIDHKASNIKYSDIVNQIEEIDVVLEDANNVKKEISVNHSKIKRRRKAPKELLAYGLWDKMVDRVGILYASVTLNEKAIPTESYEAKELPNGSPPDFYPTDWDYEVVRTNELFEEKILQSLKNYNVPNNWNVVIEKYLERKRNNLPLNVVLTNEENKDVTNIQYRYIDIPSPWIISWRFSNQQPFFYDGTNSMVTLPKGSSVLPLHWIPLKSGKSGRNKYYFNIETNESTYIPPSDSQVIEDDMHYDLSETKSFFFNSDEKDKFLQDIEAPYVIEDGKKKFSAKELTNWSIVIGIPEQNIVNMQNVDKNNVFTNEIDENNLIQEEQPTTPQEEQPTTPQEDDVEEGEITETPNEVNPNLSEATIPIKVVKKE